MPFYTCDVLITSVQEAGIKVKFYALLRALGPGELMLVMNYFGLQTAMIMS